MGPRLEWLFGTASLSDIVQSHLQLTNDHDDDYMYDIHDSHVWIEAHSSTGQFEGNSQAVAFAMCTDGVNPYSQNRYSFSSLFLVGIVQGTGSKEPQSLDPYLDIVGDEILACSN